jgi:hypothetical protein
MTNEELIAKFNPANAGNLTAADLEEMRALTNDQLQVLAKAYPNEPNRKPYIVLYDKKLKPEKQIWQPSTWQNIFNVRKYANGGHLLPYTFRSLHQLDRLNPRQQAAQQRKSAAAGSSAKKVVVDLTAQQAKDELTKHLGDKATGVVTKTVTSPGAAKGTSAKKTEKPATTKKTATAATGVAKASSQGTPGDQEFTDGQ